MGGDQLSVRVDVQKNGTLALFSQSPTKIFRVRGACKPSRQELAVSVAEGALFVLTPDPVVPLTDSAYESWQHFELEPGASAVVVDWFAAGRVENGERWAFRTLRSRTKLSLAGGGAVVEAIALENDRERMGVGAERMGFDLSKGAQCDAFATVRAHGVGREDGVGSPSLSIRALCRAHVMRVYRLPCGAGSLGGNAPVL